MTQRTSIAEAGQLATALRDTQRAVRVDWAAAGGTDTELARVRAACAAGECDGWGASPSIRRGLAEERRLAERLNELLADPGRRSLLAAALTERARVLRAAILWHRREQRADGARDEAAAVIAHAAGVGRQLTPAERALVADAQFAEAQFAEAQFAKAQPAEARLGEAQPAEVRPGEARPGGARPGGARPAEAQPAESRGGESLRGDDVIEALGALRIRAAQRQLRGGLLLTEQMLGVIRAALPALHSGAPILLIGETGGAKTALAEYLARHLGAEPEFISGYGDISAAQLIGTHELRNEAGVPVTAFEPGPLLRAMRDGRPLILDEVNAMPAEFLKRLNRILQLRPGARFAVQERAGLTIEIARGFTIIATANEHAPHRYRGIEPLSAELVNRFGANTYRVRYPDADCGAADYPRENALLATASIAGSLGQLPGEITSEHITQVARAAFLSQQVFSGNTGDGFDRFRSTDQAVDDEPGLEEAVIAPRTLVAILERAALEGTPDALFSGLARFVDGVMNRADRRVLELILESQGIRR